MNLIKILSIFVLATTMNAQAQMQEKYKQEPGNQIKHDIQFSPTIKTFGCILESESEAIHISDISSVSIIPFATNDARGKLTIFTENRKLQIAKTVNDHRLFRKYFYPLWNSCKMTHSQ